MSACYRPDFEQDFEQDFDRDLASDIDSELDPENEPELTPEQAAFAEIAQRAEAGLADCDAAYQRIRGLLAEYDQAVEEAAEEAGADCAEAASDYNKHNQDNHNENGGAGEAELLGGEPRLAELGDFEVNLAPPNQEAIQRDAFVRARLREARQAAANASWQLLLGFGISFCVRVGLLGICLGGWIDRRWLGGTGYGAIAIILLVIGYSFYMLYADLRRSDERWRQERERLQAQAEREWRQLRPK